MQLDRKQLLHFEALCTLRVVLALYFIYDWNKAHRHIEEDTRALSALRIVTPVLDAIQRKLSASLVKSCV